MERIEYRHPRAEYRREDFGLADWADLDSETTLLFFDDHQNAYERLKSAAFWGFRHLIFEDNYPSGCGDCYSIKQVIAGAGHHPVPRSRGFARKVKDRCIAMLGGYRYPGRVPPNSGHFHSVEKRIEVYDELPPVTTAPMTRFGVPWGSIPCAEALFPYQEMRAPEVFQGAESGYTYLCYLKLKGEPQVH